MRVVVRARLRAEQGFGLIELMISMVMLNVGILAIVAAFNSGGLAIQRASETSTATVVADKQMELYRALTLRERGAALVRGDDGRQRLGLHRRQRLQRHAGRDRDVSAGHRRRISAIRVARRTGPDSRSYRVDTYIVAETPPNGRAVKRVTVVVRRASDSRSLARITSTFDASTG